ncbi:MAG: hypothetical protein ACXACC_04525 [Promethearchaeota archaeon]|jgi:hypothetical protein
MKCFDFDENVQKVLNDSFSDIELTNWKIWLEISSSEEFEELCLKNSGLSSVNEILKRVTSEITDSRSFSINLENFLSNYNQSYTPIVCHTSGTTNSKISALKWFFMAKSVVQRNWAPGMQAIFESSGLDSKSSAVIFVPSRIKLDGLQYYEGQPYISLYSSEFSQRVMLSIIKPKAYTFYEYKNSKSLDVISKILDLDDIRVISAPALTILGWADLEKLTLRIQKSLNDFPDYKNPILEKLILTIEKEGIQKASKIIQEKLSDKLCKATIIFSISSLSEQNWDLIRKFMKWEKGRERFTNLYVASEIGPFASSISKGDFEISRQNKLYVFPLTLAVIEHHNKKQIISRASNKTGKLLVSRMDGSEALINIDLGDIITIKENEGLPQIDGKIIRSSFKLKYDIKLSEKLTIPFDYNIYAGDFFFLNEFTINQPRNLINCLKNDCNLEVDALILLKSNKQSWDFVFPSNIHENCVKEKKLIELISSCAHQEELTQGIINKLIRIDFIDDQPVNFLATRSEILKKVREGQAPKGILKKWPLYVIIPKNDENNLIYEKKKRKK